MQGKAFEPLQANESINITHDDILVVVTVRPFAPEAGGNQVGYYSSTEG